MGEAILVRRTIETEAAVGEAELQTLVTCETATPGAGREVIEALMEDGVFAVEAAEAQTDRVVVDGTVSCQAVYRQGDSPARAVAAQTRVSEAVQIPGVTAKSTVQVQGTVEDVRAEYENGRMIFTCALTLRVSASEIRPREIIESVENGEGLMLRREMASLCRMAAEASGETLLRQEVSLPSALDARTALMDWAQARVISANGDLGGVKVVGEVQAEALIGTGIPSRPMALVKVSLPFEKTVEMPEWLTGEVWAQAQVTRLSTGVSPAAEGEEGALLTLEADTRVSVTAFSREEVPVIADAYGTGSQKADLTLKNLDFCSGMRPIEMREPFRGALYLEEGAPGVGTSLGVRIRPSVSGWHLEEGRWTVEGALDVKAVYLPAGSEKVCAARGELPFRLECPEPLSPTACLTVTADGAEAVALMSDRLEIRCALTLSGFVRDMNSIRLVEDLALSDAPARPSGLILHFPQPGDTPWLVARQYALPLETVTALSENGAFPSDKPLVLTL